jgi:3',5'-cyclic-AMP phosphodiesterase
MTDPFLLVQLSDPHIGAAWVAGDPLAGLAAAVEAVRTIRPNPDAILISGDLADSAADTEYEAIRKLLAPLGVPVFVLAGNHDDRAALRRQFELSGAGDEPIHYAADLGPMRLLVLDSKAPGSAGGQLGSEQLDWLDAELRAQPDAPTVIALHHPPFETGLPALDVIGLSSVGTAAFTLVVSGHRNVERIVAGHVHRPIVSQVGGIPALTAPSTCAQALLDFSTEELVMSRQPVGFAVHVLVDGELVSHFHALEVKG